MPAKLQKDGKGLQWHDLVGERSWIWCASIICIAEGLGKMAQVWTRPARFWKPGRSR